MKSPKYEFLSDKQTRCLSVLTRKNLEIIVYARHWIFHSLLSSKSLGQIHPVYMHVYQMIHLWVLYWNNIWKSINYLTHWNKMYAFDVGSFANKLFRSQLSYSLKIIVECTVSVVKKKRWILTAKIKLSAFHAKNLWPPVRMHILKTCCYIFY